MRLADHLGTVQSVATDHITLRPQVLYVDNAEAACRLFEHRFEDRDFDLETASDPARALARLRAKPFDVIIVAFQHQPIEPLELLRASRDLYPEALRAQVKPDPTADEILTAINVGGLSRFIPQTWSPEAIEEAIVELVDESRRRLERSRKAARCAGLEAELERVREELDELATGYHEHILDGLLAVLGFREKGARSHSYRAASYAGLLGRELGLDDADIRTLTRGALLHDLGKVGISDQILLKPGSLDESEWDEMRWHPALGHGLLDDFEFLGDARTIVLQHHERWDGTGYPNRLRGEDIHVGARITAVVDAFDAMTSSRPYRAALTFESAWDEIQRCAGSQFDPNVVEAFVRFGRSEWEGAVTGDHTAVLQAVA